METQEITFDSVKELKEWQKGQTGKGFVWNAPDDRKAGAVYLYPTKTVAGTISYSILIKEKIKLDTPNSLNEFLGVLNYKYPESLLPAIAKIFYKELVSKSKLKIIPAKPEHCISYLQEVYYENQGRAKNSQYNPKDIASTTELQDLTEWEISRTAYVDILKILDINKIEEVGNQLGLELVNKIIEMEKALMEIFDPCFFGARVGDGDGKYLELIPSVNIERGQVGVSAYSLGSILGCRKWNVVFDGTGKKITDKIKDILHG